MVLAALRGRGVDAHPFDPAERGLAALIAERFDRVFIALHGRYGEDGTMQGALELLGIPYTGSGVMASSLAMDKWRTKLVWSALGIPTPASAVLEAGFDWQAVVREVGVPAMVKPANEGSTIGISKVSQASGEAFAAAYAEAARYDPLVFAEAFVAGQELTAAVLGDEALPLVRIEAPQGNYDYHNKYFSDETRYFCPCGLPPAAEAAIRQMALRAFRALGCSGWGRADLILDAGGRPWFLEMNTSPGMTGHSLVPMAARAAGLSFDELVLRILELTHAG
jgi:D-alanine-D-alanine ligase